MGLESAPIVGALLVCPGRNIIRTQQVKLVFVMRILKTAIVLVAASAAMSAFANPDILKEFKAIYNKPDATCKICHLEPPKSPRNPFGKAVEQALDKTNDGVLTKAVMSSIEKLDSDGDGALNIDEINAGTFPGDPQSKPGASGSNNAPTEAKTTEAGELIPKHSFHPAIVHFPIALLAVAALLEILGRRKPDSPLHAASVINLALGLLSALAAIATGVVAWLRLGYRIEGDLLIHLLLASSSVIAGFVAYAQREKPSYLLLILVSGLLVLAAGHFGGNMVYG